MTPAFLRASACAFLALLGAAPHGMAQSVEPLDLTSTFTPALSFTETHSEKVVKIVDPLDPGNPTYDVAVTQASTANITANITGTVLANIDATTAFSLSLGGAEIAFSLGDIPTYVKGQTTAFYSWRGWDPVTKKAIGVNGVKLTWTATKLTVVVTMGGEETRPAAIGADAFVGAGTDPGTFPIKDTLTASLTFGDISTTAARTVYVTGTYTVTHVISGPVDDPLYEFDLYAVSETGAADYVRPTVALTSPRQGASVGGAVDVNGTTFDAKGLSGVQWTTDPAGVWNPTDDFTLTASPLDGLWGSTYAAWTASLTSLPHGTTKLYVRSVDDSGNTSVPLVVSLVNSVPPLLTGRWNGLLAPTVQNGIRGAVTFTFAVNGSFTGTLYVEGASYPFSGALQPDESLYASISRGVGKTPLLLGGTVGSFSPATAGDAGIAGDLMLSGGIVATYNVFRSPWSTLKLADASLAGIFHVKIDPAASPAGSSYAVVTTARAGTASTVFTLADGTVATWSGVMGAAGQLPAFVSLYPVLTKGVVTAAGSVSSLMTVNGAARTIDATTVGWDRPLTSPDKQFPGGFSYTLDASGSAYTAPSPATTRVMGLGSASPNATATWSGDAVTPPLSLDFTVKTSNVLSIPVTTDALKLFLTPANGAWTGSFKLPGTAVLSTCKLLIVGNEALGFWTAPAPAGATQKRYGVIHVGAKL